MAQLNDNLPYVPGQVLIQIDNNASITKVIEKNGVVNGVETRLVSSKLVSKPANIWLLEFDEDAISHNEILSNLYKDPHVWIAQNNHIVEERATTPNDPNFSQQWHHVNGNDADIDSDLAWDITTGGLTATGDTIVVCVLEGGGADWDHPDLIDNHWRNYNEIDGNGIDDDGNGYIDDFDGWNEPGNNDNISAGSHGTQVSGMIGAKGNNNSVVSGINWDVKIMQVQNGSIGSGSNPNEASVIAAYTYPLVMRQLYESSGGAQGAFVVATNASWGIDAADPNNAPLWCAFYDTLGHYGILNCGATTNSSLDVDAVGDLPTACASDYMIGITRTGNNDQMGGGYGTTTIELGAPGISVVTTSNGGGSGSTTGTSFSSPLTAGVIALLYSAPCASLAALSHADPKAAADQVRMALLDGVDPIASLSGITVTGGRLNAYNSVMEIVNNCSGTSCLTPWQVASSNVTDTQADLAWGGTGTSYNIQYRPTGSSTWMTATSSGTSTTISGLTACTEYEVQIQSVCTSATDTSSYTSSLIFTTDGCCEPPSTHDVTNIAQTTADVNWSSVLAATTYNLRYKETAGASWTDVNGVSSPHNLTGLTGCTEYEVQIQTVCGATNTAFTASYVFTTTGCGACLDMTYCTSEGASTADEWIESVAIADINNVSGDDNGYGDFTGVSTDLQHSTNYSITITPGYAGWAYNEYFNVWIDLNHDGDFSDADEHVYDAGGLNNSAVTGTINLPATSTLGLTKMRVSMKYNGAATECEDDPNDFEYGEVEDYCVTIIEPVGVESYDEIGFTLYPNPTTGVFTVVSDDQNPLLLEIRNSLGQIVMSENVQNGQTIDASGLARGMYFVRIKNVDGKLGVQKLKLQ